MASGRELCLVDECGVMQSSTPNLYVRPTALQRYENRQGDGEAGLESTSGRHGKIRQQALEAGGAVR